MTRPDYGLMFMGLLLTAVSVSGIGAFLEFGDPFYWWLWPIAFLPVVIGGLGLALLWAGWKERQ